MLHGGILGKTNQLILVIVSGILALPGCHAPSSRWNSSEGFKTQIVMATTFGTRFETVTLQGVLDQKTLNGQVVRFLFSPGEAETNGQLHLKGQSPITRFVKDGNGVNIPADVISLQMVTIYYHLQELKKLEETAQTTSVLKWPRQVGLRVNASDAVTKYNNAFYNSSLDVLYFVPYTESHTPIALNPGVIGHEHFHSYFAYLVMSPLVKEGKIETVDLKKTPSAVAKKIVYTDYILKSLNEGLADVWGWIYSQDPDFVSVSLPSLSGDRALDSSKITIVQIKSAELLKEQSDIFYEICMERADCETPTSYTASDAYTNGTALARTLKNFAAQRKIEMGWSDEQTRAEMAKKIFEFLPVIKSKTAASQLSLESLVVSWSELFTDLSEAECKTLKSSLSSRSEVQKICPK